MRFTAAIYIYIYIYTVKKYTEGLETRKNLN